MRDLNIRYVVLPSQSYPNDYIHLSFKIDQIEAIINLGEEDSKAAVQMGEGKSYQKIK